MSPVRQFSVRFHLLVLFAVGLATPVSLAQQRHAEVLTGIDVLEKTNFAALREIARQSKHGLNIGVLTNQSGRDREGRRTIDILVQDATNAVPGLHVTTLFSPEHGLSGTVDTAHANGGADYTIANNVDSATKLPIISLFGNTDADRRPKTSQLRSLDVVVIDLQDVGVRFFTYETLVGYFLEAAANTKTTIMILDRPNPIRGDIVQGPTSPARSSYINYIPIPLRHGLTLGELAKFFRIKKQMQTPLIVVAMRGWKRSMWFDQTGLPWTNPSPNLRTMNALTLYAGTGILEGANVSMNRGAVSAFETFGSPWMNGATVSEALSKLSIAGVLFVPVEFVPMAPFKFAGQLCHGVHIQVTNRDRINSPELGLQIAATLKRLYPEIFDLQGIDPVKADDDSMETLWHGKDDPALTRKWQRECREFEFARRQVLLY